jgi:hypothetical protein
VTEQDGHPPAPLPSGPPAEPDRATPLAEAAAALGFGDDRRAAPGQADQPTVALPTREAAPRAASPHVSSQQPMHPSGAGGVPPRAQPLPPPRPVRPPAGATAAPRPAPTRPAAGTVRPVARTRKARLVLKRIDPWSVFLYSVVASIFIGIATLVAVGLLYAVLSKLGVLSSLNTLIGDVTAEPGTTAEPAHLFSAGKVMTFATLIAALDVVLITALSTLGAFLYNVCASLTGGIEVTLTDQG